MAVVSLFDDDGQPNPELVDREPSHLARSSDPVTSHLAAAGIDAREGTGKAIRWGTHRHKMLAAYAYAAPSPLADFEAALLCGLYLPHVNYWHRASDLLAVDYIRATGEQVLHEATNRYRQTAVITSAGRTELERLNSEGGPPPMTPKQTPAPVLRCVTCRSLL